jgi:nucleotide-binding universal stress UspA family protein
MFVVGASGIGGYGEVGLGRVSGYLARHANCPLVVVRDDQDRSMSHEIVVGVRDADEAAAALRFAFEEAAVQGARLLAVHCWYWFPPALSLSPERRYAPGSHTGQRRLDATQPASAGLDVLDAQALSEDAAMRLAEVLNGWQDKYPGVHVSQNVVHGHPGRVLAGLTSSADLVVLARHEGRGGIRPGSGLIQSAVLNHAEGPVAVIPSV